jgi:hypothetical protein
VPYLSQGKPYLGRVLCKCLQQEEAQDRWLQDQQGNLKNDEVMATLHMLARMMYLLHLQLLPLELWIQMSTASKPRRQRAVNDNTMVSTVTNGMFAQLCLDLNKRLMT